MKRKILCTFLAVLFMIPLFSASGTPGKTEAATIDPRVSNVYYLRNAKSGLYLDLQGSGAYNSVHLQQYPFGYPSELFQVCHTTYGYYLKTTLAAASGTMVLDGRYDCVAGVQVILYEYDEGAPEQYWLLTQNDDGSYCLSPTKNTALNLAVSGGSMENNAKVVLATKDSNDLSQKWYFEKWDESAGIVTYQKYYLRNKQTGKYLDLQGNQTANGTHFQQYTFGSNYTSEQFEIGYDNGYCVVKTSLNTSQVMDGSSNCVDGAQVILYAYDEGAPEQMWHFKRNDDDGTYCISPAENINLNLTVAGTTSNNNAKVILKTGSYTTTSGQRIYDDRQKWYLEPIDAENFGLEYMFDDWDFVNISSGYKLSERPVHYAIDIIGRTKVITTQPIYSPISGKIVVERRYDTDSGNYVVIETDTCWPGTGKKLRLTFAHMNDTKDYYVEHYEGKRVFPGDLLGYVGNTGDSDGNHLHHAVYKPDSYISDWEDENTSLNPQYFYPYASFTGKLSTIWP